MTTIRTHDFKNNQYVFGFKRNNKDWLIVPHKFILISALKHPITGQFIRSIQFNQIINIGEEMELLILGIKGSFNYKNITNLINETYKYYNTNELTEKEFKNGITFKETFYLSKQKTEIIYNNNLNKMNDKEKNVKLNNKKFIIRLYGFHNKNIELSLKASYYENQDTKLCINLPSFIC